MENPEATKDVVKILYDIVSPNNISAVIHNYFKLWTARWQCFGQCWSKTNESDALWRIYSYEKMAVRIETEEKAIRSTLENLFQQSNQQGQYSIEIGDVQYDLKDSNCLKEQGEMLKNSLKVVTPFFHKRKAFQHENEKRVILFDKSKADIEYIVAWATKVNLHFDGKEKCFTDKEMVIESAVKEIRKMQKNYCTEQIKSEMFVKVPCLSQYIQSVMVHPQADEWIVNLVEKICQRGRLNFIGKSHMYDNLV